MNFSEKTDTLVVGAGLSGLYSAFLLATEQRRTIVLEARERIGGRISGKTAGRGFSVDLGPSWFWPRTQPLIADLTKRLDLAVFRQYEEGRGRFQMNDGSLREYGDCAVEPASWRLAGGMESLVKSLTMRLPPDLIRLREPVCRLERLDDGVAVAVGDPEAEPEKIYHARRVILALPPRLAASTILFTPEPGAELIQAMLKTPTWMASQAKFYALYDKPFWRHEGLSGQGFSQVGPIAEIHDGSAVSGPPFALTGFLGLPPSARTDREELVLACRRQLGEIFGTPAGRPEKIFLKDWSREPRTATRFDQVPLTVHPRYRLPAGKTGFWNDLVLFAGTETSEHQGGYLEGALAAALRVRQLL